MQSLSASRSASLHLPVLYEQATHSSVGGLFLRDRGDNSSRERISETPKAHKRKPTLLKFSRAKSSERDISAEVRRRKLLRVPLLLFTMVLRVLRGALMSQEQPETSVRFRKRVSSRTKCVSVLSRLMKTDTRWPGSNRDSQVTAQIPTRHSTNLCWDINLRNDPRDAFGWQPYDHVVRVFSKVETTAQSPILDRNSNSLLYRNDEGPSVHLTPFFSKGRSISPFTQKEV